MTKELPKNIRGKLKSTPPWRVPGRIAYVVSHSYPYSSNGYAVRTHGVASALVQHGHSVIAVNRPGSPWDLPGFKQKHFPFTQTIDGVRYYYLKEPSRNALTHQAWLNEATAALEKFFKTFKPSIIIAASNWENALPAQKAANKIGLPFFYEVRGFWEITRASGEPGYEKSQEYADTVAQETEVAKAADRVFTLNRFMKDELIRRGVDGNKIDLVPNGISGLPDLNKSPNLTRKDLGISSQYVVGYIGSFNDYEGLDDLVRAAAQLIQQGLDLSVLLVGSSNPVGVSEKVCPMSQQYLKLAEELGIANRLFLPGRVGQGAVGDYYRMIDLVVIPRKPLPVCELVSPMKPLEAIARQKTLIVSDVKPLTELCDSYSCVTSFKVGDLASLCAQLQQRLINKPEPPLKEILKQLLFSQQIKSLITALSSNKLSEKVGKVTTGSVNEQPAGAKIIWQKVERKELTNIPEWHGVAVIAGQQITINAAVECPAAKSKAVFLIKSIDANGKELNRPCGKLAKSDHFKAYFKYLPCTGSSVLEQHSFTVPEQVASIQVAFCRFNAEKHEQIYLEQLSIQVEPDDYTPTQFTPPSKQAAEISILGWPDYTDNGKPYIIGIMDEFTTGCFEQDLNLIQPRPDNWYALAEKYKPVFFFIESAWKGNFGSWQYRVAEYANKPGQEIVHITQYAKQKGIPTIFWNKEDPVHHQKFMCSAKLVDHIFTTDANMRQSYKDKTGNPNVHALPFAAQPALHKPAPLEGRRPRSCFAGSWYGNRHAERGVAMRWLLQAANRHGLEIYDRNHGTGIFPFPEEYQAGIKGSLPYKELCNEYSRYRVFLNVNSVTDSPTMFSRRVFELMACGTPVVSTYARGIDELFESDAVWLVNSEVAADEAIHTLLNDDVEWRRRSLAGIREVFAKHTYAHRLNDIFGKMGIDTRLETDPKILLLAKVGSQSELQKLFYFVENQKYSHFKLLIERSGELCYQPLQRPDLVELVPQGQIQNFLLHHTDYRAIGWITPNAHYGAHYLRDLANAMIYEPTAEGWSKALKCDAFAYNQPTLSEAVIWCPDTFRKYAMHINGTKILQEMGLFVTDSTEFSMKQQVLQGVGA
ncbi:MAG: glycosyltransferase [Gammaproteobacteria bacterium]|nr:glycosyltransferase [Gammaproteobacteria bacterium]